MYRFIFFFSLLILGILPTFGQEKLYNFRYFTKEDGLPTNKIRGVAEDNQGLIWLVTDKGLVNYDGLRFHAIQLNQANSYFTNNLSAISIDSKSDKIWMTSYNEGLICYDKSKPLSSGVKFYNAKVGKSSLIKNELYTVLVAESGLVYFGGQETDLQFYNPQRDTIENISLNPKNGYETIFSIREDHEGKIWIGTRYSGFYVYNPNTKAITHVDLRNQKENGARCFVFVDDAVYLSYYDYDLVKIAQGSATVAETNLLNLGKNNNFYDNEITDITYLSKYDKLLLSHVNRGLFLYDLKQNKSTSVGWHSILPNERISTRINQLLQAESGVYIASDDGLLFYSESLNIINDFIPYPFPITEVFHVNNEHWVLSQDFIGKVSADYTTLLDKIVVGNLKISEVNVIDKDIYISTYNNGLFKVDQIRKKIVPIPIVGEQFNFKHADCNRVVGDIIDKENILWIGSWNSGLYKYNLSTKRIQLFNKSNGLIDNKIISIAKDFNNDIWLGFDGFGVARMIDKRLGKFDNYHHEPSNHKSLNSNAIFSFLLDKRGNFWYGSSANGIGKININQQITFQHIKDPNRFKNIYARRMQEDRYGRIWMHTTDGAMIFDPKYSRFQSLEAGDGIYPNAYLKSNSFTIQRDSIIWATDRGLIIGDVNKVVRDYLDVSKVVVSHFRIFNQDCSYKLFSPEILLESDQNSFSFYLSCPEVIKQNNIRFSYRLVGIDKDWILSDESNQAIYTNMDAGEYTFHARVVDTEGNRSNNITSYKIIVKGEWYKSTAFKIVIALLLLAMIFGFLFYRINQQKALNILHIDFNKKLKQELLLNEKKIIEQQENLEIERKEKIEADFRKQLYESELKAVRAQMNPHFIFNVLNSIEAYVVENDKQRASKLIHKFAALSRIVLENSQNSMVNIDAELALVQLYLDLERERFDSMFDYKIEIDESIDPFNDKIPSMLIQPIVENAVHHGIRNLNDLKGDIKIVLQKKDGYMMISVFDNGIGFQNEEKFLIKKSSFGIKGVESRLKMLNPNSKIDITGVFINTLMCDVEFTTEVKMVFPLMK